MNKGIKLYFHPNIFSLSFVIGSDGELLILTIGFIFWNLVITL